MYRFLVTPRWLGLAALTVVLALVMGWLGQWQLDRYRQKTAINDRVDAAATAAPVPVTDVLRPGQVPPAAVRYTRVYATGRYDPGNEILVRGRTVDGRVGFEVVTPLVLPDGAAVLVARGWVPAGASAAEQPAVPAPPDGEVTVTGVVRLPERARGRIERQAGRLQVRRIAPNQLGPVLPYPVLGGYLAVEQEGLTPIRTEYLGTLQNAGYTVQWWAFAALTVFGYGYLARRQARDGRPPAGPDHDPEYDPDRSADLHPDPEPVAGPDRPASPHPQGPHRVDRVGLGR